MRRRYKSKCPECRRTFRHRKGVVYCSHACQDRSWRKRHPDKARAYARSCYHRHRKKYIKASALRKKKRQRDPAYRAQRRRAWAAWYRRNWNRVNAAFRLRYAKQKSSPVRPWGPWDGKPALPDLIPKPPEEATNGRRQNKTHSSGQRQAR
jgi:hypothetical protein